jgi:hypothetical protein
MLTGAFPSSKLETANHVVAYSDIHVYYFQKNASQMKFARELWERIRRECKMALFILVKAAHD